MRKNRIRLTESDLRRIVNESVKRILKESIEGDIQRASDEYSSHHDFPLSYYDYYGPDEPNPNNSTKQDEIDYSWKALGALNKLKSSNMKSRQENEEFFNKFAPSRRDFINGQYDGGLYDGFKNYLDGKWQDTKDADKYIKQADSRPLHRKGSLNREL